MKLTNWVERWALVTGASSGIGKSFAMHLAKSGVNLVITARREEILRNLATEWRAEYGVCVEWVAIDLAEPMGAQALFDFTQQKNIVIDILINNAGFACSDDVVATPVAGLEAMIQVNMTSLVVLSRLYLPQMQERKRGNIILVGSLNSFFPFPGFCVYSATKAFVRSFGEALALECKATGVDVFTVHPGATSSEFVNVANLKIEPWMESTFMPSEQVASFALNASYKGSSSRVVGFMNRVVVFLIGLLPRVWVGQGARAIFSRLR